LTLAKGTPFIFWAFFGENRFNLVIQSAFWSIFSIVMYIFVFSANLQTQHMTPAINFLKKHKVLFKVHEYQLIQPTANYGQDVADALGVCHQR